MYFAAYWFWNFLSLFNLNKQQLKLTSSPQNPFSAFILILPKVILLIFFKLYIFLCSTTCLSPPSWCHFKPFNLRFSIARTVMLWTAFVSRSNNFAVVITPLLASILKNLSKSVFLSIEYLVENLKKIYVWFLFFIDFLGDK